MLTINNTLHIEEYDREARLAILAMGDQLSRLSYAEKNMYLFLESTYTGDLGGTTQPLFTFLKKTGNFSKSNVNIVTVSSGELDLMGTVLAQSGTEKKRYAVKDTMFSLNPGLKNPHNSFTPGDFLYKYALEDFFEVYFGQETNEFRRLANSTEHFGTDIAIKLGIIDSVVLLEDLIIDQDCTEEWNHVYHSTEWDLS